MPAAAHRGLNALRGRASSADSGAAAGSEATSALGASDAASAVQDGSPPQHKRLQHAAQPPPLLRRTLQSFVLLRQGLLTLHKRAMPPGTRLPALGSPLSLSSSRVPASSALLRRRASSALLRRGCEVAGSSP